MYALAAGHELGAGNDRRLGLWEPFPRLLQDDLQIGLGHPLPYLPMDQVAAVPIQNTKRAFDTWSISIGVDALECSERPESGSPSAGNAKHSGLSGPHKAL